MRLAVKTYTFGYGTPDVIALILQCKINYEYDKRRKTPYCRLPNSGYRGDRVYRQHQSRTPKVGL